MRISNSENRTGFVLKSHFHIFLILGLISFALMNSCGSSSTGPSGVSEHYQLLTNEPYGHGIWVMNLDGSEAKKISDFGWWGEFSCNGEKIAFGEYYKNGIWVMNYDGSDLIKISDEGIEPSWSPDGTRIVFATGTATATDSRIWVMNADGSNCELLTARVADSPNWAHHSDQIVFSSWLDGIWIINADGSDETKLLDWDYASASWSPDDQQLITSRTCYLYLVNSDGTNPTQITTTRGSDPVITYDNQVYFTVGDDSVFVLDLSTGVETLVSVGTQRPDWCPYIGSNK